MQKDAMERPATWKERGGLCPECREKGIKSPTVARRSRKTSELYFGCEGFLRGCRFKGCRSH
jgi:hypothetical protein